MVTFKSDSPLDNSATHPATLNNQRQANILPQVGVKSDYATF